MRTDYQPFIDRLIHKYEGGYCWDKGDPGGPTNFGITCYDLAEHRSQKMTSMSAWAPLVKAMSLGEAEDIYRTKYATGIRFDDLRAGVDCVMLDYGVNSGIGRPIAVARALLNRGSGSRVTDDLIKAINDANPDWFIDSMDKERLHFMHQIRGGSAWSEFGHGWGARVDDLDLYTKHLASGSGAPAPTPPDLSKVPTPKATHVPDTAHTGAAGGGTIVATGAAAHAAGLPYWVVGGVVVVGVAGAVGLIVWQGRKAAAANAKVILPPSIKPQPR